MILFFPAEQQGRVEFSEKTAEMTGNARVQKENSITNDSLNNFRFPSSADATTQLCDQTQFSQLYNSPFSM